ncbi:hypothetical protein BD324DRAFT_653050 [Kockovaella imperatae]|uniref:Uncharacterized protein n=1 Tax=Kockovaella imperatae TaxID=4999 RepID=A0A1Y1U9V1_9TREE|nr:hypothetical protein BD324DRAFT_653050 [Kockovaella imperatae]ORX34792.1 hypothetical protein BD324DRAFT_653050 [Kockovaella imperatae]
MSSTITAQAPIANPHTDTLSSLLDVYAASDHATTNWNSMIGGSQPISPYVTSNLSYPSIHHQPSLHGFQPPMSDPTIVPTTFGAETDVMQQAQQLVKQFQHNNLSRAASQSQGGHYNMPQAQPSPSFAPSAPPTWQHPSRIPLQQYPSLGAQPSYPIFHFDTSQGVRMTERGDPSPLDGLVLPPGFDDLFRPRPGFGNTTYSHIPPAHFSYYAGASQLGSQAQRTVADTGSSLIDAGTAFASAVGHAARDILGSVIDGVWDLATASQPMTAATLGTIGLMTLLETGRDIGVGGTALSLWRPIVGAGAYCYARRLGGRG